MHNLIVLRRKSFVAIAIASAFALLFSFGLLAPIKAETVPPTLSSDKADYLPGQTATITGVAFASNQVVTLTISAGTNEEGTFTQSTQNVTATEEGSFVTTYTLDNVYRPLYTVVATDNLGAYITQMSFTDAAIGTYDQCSNDLGTGYTTGDTGCRWINGNLQSNNSVYQEGDSTVQRLWLDGFVPGSSHSITFQYGTTKAGKHAYDYLTTWDQSENWIQEADRCQGITGCTSVPETTLAIPHDPNGSGQFETGTRNFVMRGGTMSSATIPSLVSGTYAGDSETAITVVFNVAANGAMCVTKNGSTTCGIAIWFGAHISKTSEWQSFNNTTGATSISGSPYHVALDKIDGSSAGQRDNQMQSGTIVVPSTITIHKVTSPPSDTTTNFDFITTGTGYSGFSLTGGTQNQQSVSPGSYTVVETNPSPAYSNTALTCTASGTGSSATPTLGTRSVAITIGSGGGAIIDCIYTNTLQQGSLKIVKNTVGGNGTFNFTGNTGVTQLITNAGTANQTVNNLAPGSNYNIAETAQAGWDLTSAVCDNGTIGAITVVAGQTTTCTFTNTKKGHLIVQKTTLPGGDLTSFTISASGSGTITGGGAGTVTDALDFDYEVTPGTYSVAETVPAGWSKTGDTCQNVVVAAGETKYCLLTNTKKGHIVVNKITVGGDDNFAFTTTGSGYAGFSLANGGSNNQEVAPGAYTVAETAKLGWDLTSAICDQGETPASLDVEPGETVTCTFTNTKQGSIKIVKNTVGGNGTFNFTGNTGVTQLITNAGTANQTVNNLVPGSGYNIAETAQAGWDLTSAICDNGTIGAITVVAGQTTTCTFTNTKKGSIVIEKQTLPNGSGQAFDFTGEIATSLTDDQTSSKEVVAGQYSVTESALAGWDLTSLVCNDQNSTGDLNTQTATFNVEAGETVKCTFTNTQKAHIIIVKNAVPNDAQDFTFTGSGSIGAFSLDDDADNTLPKQMDFEVLAGEYSVTEDALAGWKFAGAVCSDQSPNTAINVEPGETVTCTFTNKKLAKLTLVKNTVGGNDTFDFVMTGETLAPSAQLTTVGGTKNEVFENLDPDNTYTITETPIPSGWALSSSSCTGTNTPDNITPNSGEEVVCTFVNNKPVAKIALTPLTATNKIGDDHVIFASVEVNNGDGVWVPADNGTVATFSIINSLGATANFVGGNTCVINAGVCSVTINSPTVGHVEVNATVSPTVLGVVVSATSGTGGDNSEDAQKDYVNAKISIAESATNEVGNPHIFTVTVEKNTGSGFVGVAGIKPVVVFTPNAPGTVTDNCATIGTDADGKCTVEVNSNQAGVFTATASADISVNSVQFNLVTNSQNGNSSPAVKTYVDGRISIGNDGVNEIGDPHTFTAHFEINNGSAWLNAPIGTVINFEVISGPGVLSPTSCTVSDSSGACSVTLNSDQTGETLVKATSQTSALTDGLLIIRYTNAQAENSGPATKKWVDAYITIGETATNNITDPHVFTVTVTQVPGTATPALTADVSTLVSPVPGTLNTTCNSSVPFVGNVATCTITVNSNVAGIFTATASATMNIGGINVSRSTDGSGQNSGSAVKTYVAGALKITKVVEGLGNVVNTTSISKDFTVTVTGPSYPGGHNIIFHLANGVLQAPDSVILDPVIPGQYTVTEADAGTEWSEVVSTSPVDVVASQPASEVTVTNTYVPGNLDVTKALVVTNYLFPTNINNSFTINVSGPSYPLPDGTDLVFNVNNGVVTPATQSLTNLIPGEYSVNEANPGDMWTVSGTGNVAVVSGQTASKTITNTIKLPSTTITMTPDVYETTPGGNVTLTITDTNNGAVPISNPTVELYANNVLVVPAPTYASGDINLNGIMDIGETWTWTWIGAINTETVFTVNGIGTDPLGNPVNGPTYSSETTSQTIKVIGATRTQGFWQTHTEFTSYVAGTIVGGLKIGDHATHKGGSGGDGSLSNNQVLGGSELFGGFYANIAQKTTGKGKTAQRTEIEKARMQLLQQLIAAKLNCAAFGCSSTIQAQIVNADDKFANGSKAEILAAAAQMDAFNNSGDSIAIDPNLPPTGKATPKISQSYADLAFWNNP